MDESGFKISVSSPSLRNLFGDKHASDTFKSLKGKFYTDFETNEISPIDRTATKRDLCSVERYSDVNIIIKVIKATKFVHFNFYQMIFVLLIMEDKISK